MAIRTVFYSFHYDRDKFRVHLVRNIGAVDGSPALGGQEWETVRRSSQQGVVKWIDEQMAYLLKGAAVSELSLALDAVMKGEKFLTPKVAQTVVEGFLGRDDQTGEPVDDLTERQREILQLISEGRSTGEMAGMLDVSVKTIETHRSRLMERLGIRDVPGLVRFAVRAGLVPPDG